PRSLRHPLLPPLPWLAGGLPALAQDGDRAYRPGLLRLAGAVPLRAAAVLPGFDPAGADGGPGAGRGRLAARHRGGRAPAGGEAGRTRGRRELRRLHRQRLAALLPAAGPEAATGQLRPVRAADAGHRIAGTGAGVADRLVRERRSEEHTSELQSRENLVC